MVLRNRHGIDGDGVSPSSSDILSISRGIFKWLRQQQVVNPFFKGYTATVRFEVARVKRTPSGDLFVFFTPSLTAASFRPRQAPSRPPNPGLDTSQPTFARFPITPFPTPFHRYERIPQRLHGLRGEKGFPVIGNSLFGSARLLLNWYNGYHVTSLFDFLPESFLRTTFHALE